MLFYLLRAGPVRHGCLAAAITGLPPHTRESISIRFVCIIFFFSSAGTIPQALRLEKFVNAKIDLISRLNGIGTDISPGDISSNRPHSALGNLAPEEFARGLAVSYQMRQTGQAMAADAKLARVAKHLDSKLDAQSQE